MKKSLSVIQLSLFKNLLPLLRIHSKVLMMTLLYILLGVQASENSLFSFLHYPFDGLLFFTGLAFLSWPFFKTFFISLEDLSLPLFSRVTFSLGLTLATFAFITSVGVFSNTYLSLYLLLFASIILTWYKKSESVLPKLKWTMLTSTEKMALAVCLFLSCYYSYKYLYFYPYAIADADSASVAQLAAYQFKSFPRIENTLPVVLNALGLPKLSTVHIIQSPFISSLVGALSLASRVDLSRSIYWIWIYSAFILFLAPASLIILLIRKSSKEIIYWLPALILIFHNRQFQFCFVGGQVQEIFTLSLLTLSLALLLSDKFLFAGIAMGASLAFQPDLAFPWALGISLLMLFKNRKNFQALLTFSMATLVILSPFLWQQWIVYSETGLKGSNFIRESQYLYTLKQYFGMYDFFILIYTFLILFFLKTKSQYQKVGLHFFCLFVFFLAYPWVLHFLFPQNSTMTQSSESYGLFKDILFPFCGKYYFCLMGTSWCLTLLSSLGLLSWYQSIKSVLLRKNLGMVLSVTLLLLAAIEHKRRHMFFRPITTKEKVESLGQIKKMIPMESRILASSYVPKKIENWWIGPILNSTVEESRIMLTRSDIFINSKFSERLYSVEFWQTLQTSSTPDSLVIKKLTEAKKFYHFIIADIPECLKIDSMVIWKKKFQNEHYCLFGT